MQFTQMTPSTSAQNSAIFKFDQNAFRIVSGRPLTSSRTVSKYFEKRHDSVMRDIENLIEKKPELKQFHNFVEMVETVEIGSGAKREVKIWMMDKKGFSILAMGFTGIKALDFKCAFYDEFERMEEELRNSTADKMKAVIPLTPSQQYKIQRAVAERAKGSHVHFNTIYKAIKIYFKVAKYDQIPASRFDECINFIQTVDLRIPEVLSDQPVEFPKPQLPSCPHCELITRWNLQQASAKEIQQLTIDARNALAAIEKERIRAWTCLHEIVFKLKAFV